MSRAAFVLGARAFASSESSRSISRMLSLRGRLLCAVALVAATVPARAGAQQVSVSGVVHDATSSVPLVGAIVTLGRGADERTTRTDANGAFSFVKVVRGTYPLVVRRLGYEPSRADVEVPPAEPIVVALRRVVSLDTVRVQAATQGIYGAVGTSRDLRPLNASVQILGTSVSRLRTDSTGHFFAPVKTPGPYLVRASADGYTAQTVSVTVRSNDGVEVALLLDSATGPADHSLEMAYADFADRMVQRGLASALVPRTDLTRFGDEGTLAELDRVGALVRDQGTSIRRHGVRLRGRPSRAGRVAQRVRTGGGRDGGGVRVIGRPVAHVGTSLAALRALW